MQKFGLATMLLAMLFCVVTQILASPTSSLTSINSNYSIVDASWQVQLVPGGPTTIVNGTIQQVKAKLAVSNPGWKFEASGLPTAAGTADYPVRFQELWHWCGATGDFASSAFYEVIREGVYYLRGTGGAAVAAGKCARISCSWNSAILWCNDNDYNLEFHTSDPFIEAVTSLDHGPCAYYYESVALMLGRVHTVDKWNILVHGDEC